LKEIERAIRGTGTPVVVLAPQRQQVHDLENDGLPAQTLAHLLASKQLPAKAVVILDEAGQVGGRDLRELIRLVESQHARLILSGDTRQHGAVAASDALRAIEKHSYPRVAVLRTIRRQNPDLGQSLEERRFIRQYRAAVKRAASGHITDSFDRLETLGCVRELPDEQRREAVAVEYMCALNRGEKPLVVAQTWSEVHAANEAIRAALTVTGKLKGGAILKTYQPADRTEAQRRDPRFYEAGQAVMFVKGYGRFGRGDLCEVAGANQRGVVLVKNGRRSTVSYRYAGRFSVARAVEIEVAPGDRLQLKANTQSVEGTPLRNGELVTVARIDPTGTMAVTDEQGATKTLGPSQRLLVRGYAVTSYASQGKTADTVILADTGNPAATNAQQWYVSISRGRKRVMVYTPDKAELRFNIQRSGTRELATDFVKEETAEVMRIPAPTRRLRELIAIAKRTEYYEQQRLAQREHIAQRI
jgi:ATP-dependent exoDNAse (exonuclease V) alpha subunit